MVVFRRTRRIFTGIEFEYGTPENKRFQALLNDTRRVSESASGYRQLRHKTGVKGDYPAGKAAIVCPGE
jgi:hypothetical protein